MGTECVNILLVEDNPGDVKLTQAALKRGHICNNLFVTKDGEEALDFLHKRGEYSTACRPHLILLDLNLPKKSGREVLMEIKEDFNLKDIPVCVLTGSKAEEDIVKSYKLHANCYLVKPVEVSEFMNIIRSVENFWFKIVMIPDALKQDSLRPTKETGK
jgi:chemotaxis family two-component system response regulator Rcp1